MWDVGGQAIDTGGACRNALARPAKCQLFLSHYDQNLNDLTVFIHSPQI
jgi:hypothetical protein